MNVSRGPERGNRSPMAESVLYFPRTVAVSSNVPTAHFSATRSRIEFPSGTEADVPSGSQSLSRLPLRSTTCQDLQHVPDRLCSIGEFG